MVWPKPDSNQSLRVLSQGECTCQSTPAVIELWICFSLLTDCKATTAFHWKRVYLSQTANKLVWVLIQIFSHSHYNVLSALNAFNTAHETFLPPPPPPPPPPVQGPSTDNNRLHCWCWPSLPVRWKSIIETAAWHETNIKTIWECGKIPVSIISLNKKQHLEVAVSAACRF